MVSIIMHRVEGAGGADKMRQTVREIAIVGIHRRIAR